MTYTTEDLQKVQAQKIRMGSGAAVTQVRSANGTTLTYQGMTLADIDQLERQIRASLDAAAGAKRRSRTMHVVTSKGV